jgi:hypothetical protein
MVYIVSRAGAKLLCLGAFVILLAVSCVTKENQVYTGERISIAKLASLHRGMSYNEIRKILDNDGSPAGSGVMIIRYVLEDDSYLFLNFGPNGKELLYAYIRQENGTEKVLVE